VKEIGRVKAMAVHIQYRLKQTIDPVERSDLKEDPELIKKKNIRMDEFWRKKKKNITTYIL
jgi:hypothetical protein